MELLRRSRFLTSAPIRSLTAPLALLTNWLVLLCYSRSGWNEANTNENDHWITLLAFTEVRAIRPDQKGNSSEFPVLGQFPVSRLHGQVTTDVRGGAGRSWDSFPVGDTGVEGLPSTQRRL
jgi:hypothetical protein